MTGFRAASQPIANKFAPTPAGQKPCSRPQDYAKDLNAFVGANLFAKALFLTQEMYRLHRPLREQVRSLPAGQKP
ncbi:hypothetical protein PSPTOT1_4133 [Pseudomonas syringae pv. tomato T1]|nr:hypothetical protein XJ28_28680 [Pseudomonas syringae pv. tomato]EEB58034.1 hypothetical protein PSPTOT1_4133 [Pseudomonas syringae pv. tomato T1]